jgi:hypothetical protein
MKERYFRIGSMHNIRPGHINAPRESGLPFGYFDRGTVTPERVIFWFCVAVGLSLLWGWAG